MRFRIAHLMWFVAVCAVYFRLVCWCVEMFPFANLIHHCWFIGFEMSLVGAMVLVFWEPVSDAWRDHNRRMSEEYIKFYTSGRNVRIEDR